MKTLLRTSVCTLALLAAANAPALAGDDMAKLSIGVGGYDVFDSNEAADFRLEYRSGKDIWIENLKPWGGVEVTSDASLWIGGGIAYDWKFAERFYATPSFGAGFYAQGNSDKDLSYPLEFRSQLEIGHEFEDTSRVGVAISHISNASLDDDNPGTEIINLYWHMPINSVF